jgi:nicotinamidase-related amidase
MKAAETAVILIEFQNEFCKAGGKMFDAVKDELARQGTLSNAVRLAQKARQKGCLVIHCPFVYDKAWAEQHGVCGIIAQAARAGAFQPGQWGAEFIDELQPAEGEPVLSGKHALSGFTNTELRDILERRGIKHVAVAGFLTNVCVEATARSAYDLGYRVQVIRDATATTSQSNQQYVELEILPLLGGSTTVDEFIDWLE